MKFTSVAVVLCTFCVITKNIVTYTITVDTAKKEGMQIIYSFKLLHECAADVASEDAAQLESMKKYVKEMAQYIREKADDLKYAVVNKQIEIETFVELLLEHSTKFDLKLDESFTILLKQVSDKLHELTAATRRYEVDASECTANAAGFKQRVENFKVNHETCVDEKVKAVAVLEKSMAEPIGEVLNRADKLLDEFQECVESSNGVASAEKATDCLFKIQMKYPWILEQHVDPTAMEIEALDNKASEVFSSAATCFEEDPELSSDKVRQMLDAAEECVENRIIRKDAIVFDPNEYY